MTEGRRIVTNRAIASTGALDELSRGPGVAAWIASMKRARALGYKTASTTREGHALFSSFFIDREEVTRGSLGAYAHIAPMLYSLIDKGSTKCADVMQCRSQSTIPYERDMVRIISRHEHDARQLSWFSEFPW